jgi:hypothetical protein
LAGGFAYALARLHPGSVRGAMILDVPIPGIEPWENVKVDPKLWHFGFHRAPGLAEKLLAKREAIYFGYFLRRTAADPNMISDQDVERYARAYSGPGLSEKNIEKTADLTEGGLVVSPNEIDAFHKLLGTPPTPGTNTILIAHKPNIVDALGKDWFDVKEKARPRFSGRKTTAADSSPGCKWTNGGAVETVFWDCGTVDL